jgi:hypothetical protein
MPVLRRVAGFVDSGVSSEGLCELTFAAKSRIPEKEKAMIIAASRGRLYPLPDSTVSTLQTCETSVLAALSLSHLPHNTKQLKTRLPLPDYEGLGQQQRFYALQPQSASEGAIQTAARPSNTKPTQGGFE